MTEFFKCGRCAKIVKVIQEGRGVLSCCGEPMQPLANFLSAKGILEFAIEKEAEARDLYLEWAGKVEAAHLQELLRSFAGEEQGHKEMLEKVMGGGAFQPASAKVSDLKIVDYLVDILPSPDMDYQEALIIAMRREKAAFKLYSDLAAMSGDDETRALFLSLAQEEAKHKLRLETEYEKDIYREN
jgi:desulfoferrodoxin-like iron-binding protein